MPSATYSTILKANTSQHDAALSQSAQQVYKYKKETEGTKKTISNLIGKFGKFTGAIGISVTALGTLKKAFQRNQQLADAYGTAMQTAKTVSDQFVLALTKADFSDFITGLVTATKNAKELYNAMDALNTQKILSKGKLAELNFNLTQAKLDVRNGVEGARERVRQAEQAIEDELSKQLPLLEAELYAKIKEAINYDDIRKQKLDIQFVLEWSAKGDDAIERRISELKSMQSSLDRQKNREHGHDPDKHVTREMRYGEDWRGVWEKAQYEIDLLESIKGNLTDGDDLDEIQEIIASYWNLRNSIAQTKLGNVKFTKETPTPTGGSKKDNAPKYETGSIADYEQQIADLKAKLKNTVLDATGAEAVREEIKRLENEIARLQLIQDGFDFNAPVEKISTLNDVFSTIPTELPEIDPEPFIEGLQEAIDSIVTLEDKLDAISDIAGSVGDSFSSLGALMDDEGQRMMQGIGSLIGQIGQLIPKVFALIAAEEGEALASGTASAAKVPFPGNIPAMAAVMAQVLAIVATIGSLAKHANGGIITGSSTVGDMNLARVNAGEMVLNQTQQRRMWKILSGASVFHDTANLTGGEVTFRIHGADLMGTLNNYNRKRNKVI